MHEQDLIDKCNFSFKCSQQWENLLLTEDSDRRFCNSCQRDVYYVDSEADLINARNNGYCVAVTDVRAKFDRSRNNIPAGTIAGMLNPPIAQPNPARDAERCLNYLQQGELTAVFKSINSSTSYNCQNNSLDEVLSQIMDYLEKPNGNKLKVVLINYLYSQKYSCHNFEPLAIIAANRGHFDMAIFIANAVYSCREDRAKAICLTKIACHIAKARGVSKASNLLACCWHLSVTDSSIASRPASTREIIQSKTMTEMIAQILKICSLELAMKMAGSIKSIKHRNQMLSAIPLQFQFNNLLN